MANMQVHYCKMKHRVYILIIIQGPQDFSGINKPKFNINNIIMQIKEAEFIVICQNLSFHLYTCRRLHGSDRWSHVFGDNCDIQF